MDWLGGFAAGAATTAGAAVGAEALGRRKGAPTGGERTGTKGALTGGEVFIAGYANQVFTRRWEE